MFIRTVSITFITRIAIIVLSLVTSIAIARQLGVDGKGIFAVLGTVSGVAIQFGLFGLASANTHFAAKEPAVTNKLIGNSLMVAGVVGFVVTVGLLLATKYNPAVLGGSIPGIFLILTIISIPFLLLTQLVQNILVGRNDISLYNGILAGHQIILTAAILIALFKFDAGVKTIVTMTTVLASITALVLVLSTLIRYKIRPSIDTQLLRSTLSYGIKIYLNQLFYFIILRSDLYMVNQYQGTAATGVYSVAAQYADVIFLFSSTIALVLFPKISRPSEEKARLVAQVTRISIPIFLIAIVGSFFIFKPLVGLLFGEPFLGATLPMNMLYIGVFFLSIETVMAMYFAGTYVPWKLPMAWGAIAILNVLLNLMLIPRYGAWGAAMSSTVAYTLIFAIVLVVFVRTTKARLSEIFVLQKDDIKLLRTVILQSKLIK